MRSFHGIKKNEKLKVLFAMPNIYFVSKKYGVVASRQLNKSYMSLYQGQRYSRPCNKNLLNYPWLNDDNQIQHC